MSSSADRLEGPAGTFGVLLAAGCSKRWPDGPKLLAQFGGRSFLRRACEALAGSRVQESVVVLGADADRLEPECRGLGVRVVHNPDFAKGQSTSLRIGVEAAPSSVTGFLLTVADQPLLEANHLDRLIETGERTHRITCVSSGDSSGHPRGAPAWFPARLRSDLLRIDGDRGARALLAASTEDLARVELPEEALFDADRPEDLERLMASRGHGT